MEFTNFQFQSKKNSSYIKKNNEGAKIFKELLDFLSIKGIVNPLQAIEVITKLLCVREIFESGILRIFKQHPEANVFEKYIELDWDSFKKNNAHNISHILKNELFPLIIFLADQGSEFALLGAKSRFDLELSNIPNDFMVRVLDLIDLAIEKNDYTTGELFDDLIQSVSIYGNYGEFVTPNHISSLMVEMMAPNANDIILDPFCGTGTILMQAFKYIYKNDQKFLSKEKNKQNFIKNTFYGNDFNSTTSDLGKISFFLHGLQTNIDNKDTLSDEFVELNQDKYSLIITNPPFFLGSSRPCNSILQKELNTNKSELLALTACLKMLKEGGRAAIIVPQGILFGSSKAHIEIRKRLVDNNCLKGVISLPNGVFNPHTGVKASILLFEKNSKFTTRKVWFYDIQADGFSLNQRRLPLLSEDKIGANLEKPLTSEEQKKNNLPECLSEWQNKKLLSEQSFYLDRETLKENNYDLSLSKYLKDKFLQILVDKISSKPVKIADLSKNITAGIYGKNIFEDIPNAIYIPKIGKSKVLCSLNELTLKQQNYFQLVVDENKSKASFLAEFLNSEVGKFLLSRQQSGYIKTLSKSKLQLMDVYIPSLKIQDKLLSIDSKIQDKEKLILGFMNYLEDLKKILWKESNSIDAVEKEIDQFSLKFSEKSEQKAESSLSNWLETIPFPLASILRTWQATEKGDHKARYQHLLHFFEASSIFLSSIFISAFELDQNYETHKNILKNHMKKFGLTFNKSSFGTWINVIRYYSKQTRLLINKKTEFDENNNSHKTLENLFNINSLNFPSTISQIDLVQLLEKANRLRNYHAHSGFIESDENEAKALHDQLIAMLEKFRNLTGDIWDKTLLVKGYKFNLSGGIYTNHIKILKGSNAEFLKDSVPMSMALDEQFMYLTHLDSSKALKLEPFIQISSSPKSAKNACYFYNSLEKNSAKFISYHHSSDNVIEGSEFKDTISIIKSLS